MFALKHGIISGLQDLSREKCSGINLLSPNIGVCTPNLRVQTKLHGPTEKRVYLSKNKIYYGKRIEPEPIEKSDQERCSFLLPGYSR